MSVVIQIEETGPSQQRLTIEVPATAVEAEKGRVIKEINRTIRLPGFRRGKVPAGVIRKRFGPDIEQRLAETLVPRYWHQAEAEKSLEPLLPPRFEDISIEDGQPMTFVAVVETRPEIEIGPLEFDLPQVSTDPGPEEVENALRDLRRQHARWETVDRPASNGDLVVARSVELADPAAAETPAAETPAAEPASKPLQVEIGGEGVDEELSLALTGLSAGQATTFTERRPDGEAGEVREVQVSLEVQEVREQILPELDDEFAARFELESADELRRGVTERLRVQKEHEGNLRREEAMMRQLRERYPLEPPAGLVDQEIEHMMHRTALNLHAQGLDHNRIDWERVAADLRPRAEEKAHGRLILDAVAKDRDLKLDEQEFERVLARMAVQQKKSSLAIRQELSEHGRLQDLRADLLAEQTIRHLLGHDPSADADDSASDDSDSGSGDSGSGDSGSGDSGSGDTDNDDTDSREET